jgi:hypothetical protein
MYTGRSDIDNLIMAQGWNESSLLNLAMRFIGDQEQSVQNEFMDFLESAADLENEMDEEDEEEDEEGDEEIEESLWCAECGEDGFLTLEGTAHHGTPDAIDYDKDADHVALLEEEG